MLDKKQIWAIFLFQFKMGRKAAETIHNISNAFDPGTANECTVMVQEVLQSLEDEECSGQPSEFVCVLVAQSCLILCDPMVCSPLGSSVHGVFQARVMEWVAISLRDLPDPGIVPRSPVLQADSLLSKPLGKPRSWDWPTESSCWNRSSYNYTRSCLRTQRRPFYGCLAFETNWKGKKSQ